MCIRHRSFACAIFRCPLMCTGRALRQFPFVAEQVGEEVVAPLRRRGGPNHFQSAADSVTTVTFAKFIFPSEALILDVGAFWFVTHILSGNTGAVGLAKVCPPAMSATVSSSFIAIRAKVSRISRAAAIGSGFPFGPSGFT